MNPSALVLVPPCLIFALALLTRNVLISLLVGILAAGLIATNFSVLPALGLVTSRLIEQTGIPDVLYHTGSYDKILMFGFLIFLGILIECMTFTGGLRIFTRALLKSLTTRRTAQMASLALSCCFFVDDYLSALMVGSIMRPITDHFKVPRAKLAYLLNSVSSPLAVLVPASSWVGMILTQLEASGVHKMAIPGSLIITDPFRLYLYIVPFLFYPILSIFAAWYVVTRNISYGLMHRYEEQSLRDGNLFGGKTELVMHKELPDSAQTGSIWDVILPLIIFIIVCVTVLLATGHYTLFGGTSSLSAAFMSGNSIFALCAGSVCATVMIALSITLKKTVTPSRLVSLSWQGFMLMKNSLIILWLAWTLSTMLQTDLHTGEYVARLLSNTLDLTLIPVIVFLASALTTASTGSSWGSIMLLMPLALPLIVKFLGNPPLVSLDDLYQIAPVIGALLSGAIAGSHLSPITDATVMASTSAQSYHLDHVQTQAGYSLAPLTGAALAFLCVGFLHQSPFWLRCSVSLIVGLIACMVVIYMRSRKR